MKARRSRANHLSMLMICLALFNFGNEAIGETLTEDNAKEWVQKLALNLQNESKLSKERSAAVQLLIENVERLQTRQFSIEEEARYRMEVKKGVDFTAFLAEDEKQELAKIGSDLKAWTQILNKIGSSAAPFLISQLLQAQIDAKVGRIEAAIFCLRSVGQAALPMTIHVLERFRQVRFDERVSPSLQHWYLHEVQGAIARQVLRTPATDEAEKRENEAFDELKKALVKPQ